MSLRTTITARLGLVVALCLLAAVPVVAPAGARPERAPARGRPNIVVILTDDQRWDEFAKMPIVNRQLTRKGRHVREQLRVESRSAAPAA